MTAPITSDGKAVQILEKQIGANGSILVNDTSANAGNFFAVQVIADTVFTTLTGNITGDFSGVTIPAGTIIYGSFTVVTLASGTAILYKAA